MKTLIFTLSMPGRNSWNGRWSGEEKLFAIVKSVGDKQARSVLPDSIPKCFRHNFGDGWCASVHVHVSSGPAETRSVRKKSQGFCGYDWMVRNILSHGSASDKKEEVPA